MQNCLRLVFIRNTQGIRHLLQQQGDMTTRTDIPYELTPYGVSTAEALRDNLYNFINRNLCQSPDASYPTYVTKIFYHSDPLCKQTADVIAEDTKIVPLPLETSDWDDVDDLDNKTHIHIIVATGPFIRHYFSQYLESYVKCGPPLGSVSIIDKLEDDETGGDKYFLHCFGDLSCLSAENFDISHTYYWNNNQ